MMPKIHKARRGSKFAFFHRITTFFLTPSKKNEKKKKSYKRQQKKESKACNMVEIAYQLLNNCQFKKNNNILITFFFGTS